MSRLIIVSNRLPISVKIEDGKFSYEPSAGGLATGLKSFHETEKTLWVGWPGQTFEEDDEQKYIVKKLSKDNLIPVFISEDDYKDYYEGFSNRTLWPLFHYFWTYTEYDQKTWETYKRVNQQFCDEIIKIAKPGDQFWIQDYQLLLLCGMLRKQIPDASIGFFLHIPFPSYELFRTLPWRRALLEGMMGADLIAFHTFDYVRHFLSSVSRILKLENNLSRIQLSERVVDVEALPMGIDFDKFANATDSAETEEEIRTYKKNLGNETLILSVDRLDYSKGILQRLQAFEFFLEKYPQYLGKVSLIMVLVPSRYGVEEYQQLKIQIDETIGRINGKYNTIQWTPVHYFYRSFKFQTLVALYSLSHIALITPFRDGMNLVAKEYVATKTDGKGVLILSEMAGAVKELSQAVCINPNDINSIVDGLYTALNMSEEEQIQRMETMREIVKRYTVNRWAELFIRRMKEAKKNTMRMLTKFVNENTISEIISFYTDSEKRLFLLDYDGTLVNFHEDPAKALPDSGVLELLENLTKDNRNTVVIISGRDKTILERIFGHMKLDLIAEHGIFSRKHGKPWECQLPSEPTWKPDIREILEAFVDRTPGSFIEEKDFSLVWHYRKVDRDLGAMRTHELVDRLSHIIPQYHLQLLEGNKVIEVKNWEINKGRATSRWLKSAKYDFVIAVGDDYTDEDIFRALEPDHFSIKVGTAPSAARFHLKTVNQVHDLLDRLAQAGSEQEKHKAQYSKN
ncbi:MAG TPA: bifunctional alpha,alpha-trehalose-phosphate synthase (UDP-forming)/trehalose-phosphatase [Cytophagales bacterium]|nr:bifunctional alpha,alpha-trehalose-phosphate synthase (UDP-forming)/trehalose-phosphatase [Cytophagales bacterium]